MEIGRQSHVPPHLHDIPAQADGPTRENDLQNLNAPRQLLSKAPDSKVLILTTFGTSDGITHALDAGAKGAIMKNCDFGELVTAIRTVAKGEEYLLKI